MQVAGCFSLSDCEQVMNQLTDILRIVLKDETLKHEPPRIAMINTNFSLNYHVNLIETIRLFSSSPKFVDVSFNPDRYSAVMIKFQPGKDMKQVRRLSDLWSRGTVGAFVSQQTSGAESALPQVSVSIFSTGKTIITGAETLREIVFAYKVITDFVNLHADKIKVRAK